MTEAIDYMNDPPTLRRFIVLANITLETITKQDSQLIEKALRQTATPDDFAFWANSRRDVLHYYENERAKIITLFTSKDQTKS